MNNVKNRNIKRHGQSKSDLASGGVALRGLHEKLDTLEKKAGRLDLPLVSHMIGVASLLIVEKIAEERAG